MGRCKNCIHWMRNENSKQGHCYNDDKFVDTSGSLYFKKIEDDTLEYNDFEGFKAYFTTGENFGCVHFKQK